jgi:hypothetical protein
MQRQTQSNKPARRKLHSLLSLRQKNQKNHNAIMLTLVFVRTLAIASHQQTSSMLRMIGKTSLSVQVISVWLPALLFHGS